jgi:hypothetical protein
MKTFSNLRVRLFAARAWLWLALVSVALVAGGCGKRGKSAAVTPSPESLQQAQNDHMPESAATPAAAPGQVTAPDGGPDLSALNRSLLRWVLQNRRRPASFEDFAATAGFAIPPAPAGKKYVIAKNMHIQLISQ